jgi:glycosyltransferase involved in cell wall biosynthesis
MPNARPAVSVVIPVYNGAQWIGHALRSVFAQTYRDFEVIVVDDGSTDDLEGALREWSDRIVFARQPNAGPAAARNRAIRLAKGDLIAFLDADDEWLPEKLALQVGYFDRYPQTGLLHTATIGDDFEEPAGTFAPPVNVFCALFHTKFFIRTLTVMIPRAVLLETGGFDERREIYVEDWDLWLRIAARHPVGYLPRPLALHRLGGHMSSDFEKTFAGQALVVDKARGLCRFACAAHRAAPDRCLSERRHDLHWMLAYERFRRGHREDARLAFGQALAARPGRLSTYVRYASCFVTEQWVARLRAWRRRLTGPVWHRPANVPPASGPGERLTIAFDTVYRRSRHRIARMAHAADDRVARAVRPRRRRVLFEAASPMSFGVFQPVYRRLAEDRRIEFWFTAPGRAWAPDAIFGAVGIRERVITPRQAAFEKWDLCVNTDFFEMTHLRRRTRRVHLFHGVAGKYDLDAPVERAPEIASFACLMFPNEDRLRRYVQAGLVPAAGPTAALVGYPKVDALVDGSLNRSAILEQFDLHGGRPVVLYAPTWSPHSSLNLMGEAVIDCLAAAGYQVIVKLHDRSYDRLPRGAGGIDWAKRLARYGSHPAVRVVRQADASRCLFAADALVTDHSSVGFEFMLLDRPIVVLDCPDLVAHARINREKVQQLREAADVVRTSTEVPDAVAAALAAPSRRSHVRRRVAETMFYRAGTATERATALLYDFLELPAPVPQPAKSVGEIFVSTAS